MKVLFVKAPSDMHVVIPPLSIAYLSASIRDKAEIRILDCLKEKYTYENFREYIQDFMPNVVGFTGFTMEINSILKCARIVKAISQSIITVVGGPHASTSPEDILSDSNIDFIFRGEAEAGFPVFIDNLKQNKINLSEIPGLGYREKINGEVKIKLNKIKLVEDLDSLPFPDYDLMKFTEYPKLYLSRKHPAAPILTSRGCPFLCTFCSGHRISGKKFRFRSPENVIKEIKHLKEKYNVKEIQIWDDNFTLDKTRAIKFCDLLIKERMGIIWWCPNGVRMETLDYSLLKKMKESGCYAMVLGIESGSEQIQKDMKKNLDFNKLREVVKYAKKLDIRMQGFFIIGYPTESKEDILKTIELAKSLELDRATFGLFQPLAGSEIYSVLKDAGRLNNIDFSKVEYSKPSILPVGIRSFDELKRLQRKALIEFYLRPKIFIRFLFENLSINQLKEVMHMVEKYILNK